MYESFGEPVRRLQRKQLLHIPDHSHFDGREHFQVLVKGARKKKVRAMMPFPNSQFIVFCYSIIQRRYAFFVQELLSFQWKLVNNERIQPTTTITTHVRYILFLAFVRIVRFRNRLNKITAVSELAHVVAQLGRIDSLLESEARALDNFRTTSSSNSKRKEGSEVVSSF